MKVILKEPGEKPRIVEVDNDHKALHEALGGYMEHIGLGLGIGKKRTMMMTEIEKCPRTKWGNEGANDE